MGQLKKRIEVIELIFRTLKCREFEISKAYFLNNIKFEVCEEQTLKKQMTRHEQHHKKYQTKNIMENWHILYPQK